MVGKQTLLERDPANHPVYLGTSDQSGLLTRREEVRLSKVQQRRKTELFDDDEEDN